MDNLEKRRFERKQEDGILDFRALNEKNCRKRTSINIVDILDHEHDIFQYDFSDLASGFHQIKIDPAEP